MTRDDDTLPCREGPPIERIRRQHKWLDAVDRYFMSRIDPPHEVGEAAPAGEHVVTMRPNL